MKVALIMIMCSQVAGECMKPHLLSHHDTFYDCLIAGYEEAKNKTEELGRSEVSKNEIVVKFKCYYDSNEPEKKNGIMFCIVWLQNNDWKIFTNEVWGSRKEAEDYGKRNKFKKSVQWKVLEYDRKYHV